ncbi:MAG: pantetheine-phosphate adenylyltransferase [Bacillota bacterium]|nr:pantetheine-phosphate adenylyltransferase [Bacillota bacterium]
MSIAIYPGSFDPLTKGHLDIITRAARIFEELVVVVSVNTSKTAMFTQEQRKQMIEESVKHLPNVKVDTFSGLLVDYVKERKGAVIVKGLRALLDFEDEFKMALINRHLNEEAETVFLTTSMNYAHISSSLVKEVFHFGGDISSMVPEPILKWCTAKEER